jgi:O-antigen/teichoic acid export membrane protein
VIDSDEPGPNVEAEAAAGAPAAARSDRGDEAHREEARHFRGSTLLVAGKFIGVGLDLLTQIVIVRALSRTEFGAFAFGLAVASFAATVALLGLDKTISRFVPLYDEGGDQRRLAGSLVLAFGVVAAVCAAMLLGLLGLQTSLGGEIVENELARQLLLILFLLTPIRAFDSLLTACFAIFGSARSIVIRRNIIAPGLQLLVVTFVLLADQPPRILAIGYVVAGAVGLAAFAAMLWRLLQRAGIADRIRRRDFVIPARPVLGFSLPLLSSDVVFLLRTSAVIILLQYLANSNEVAAYGAVLPLARQNLLVYQSFGFLFVPVASRLFARSENDRLRAMYWQTSAWIAVATFPALALTVALAQPLTVLLFGQAYADASIVLAILAIGHYFSAAFGFNALTLRVQGSVRFIVSVDVVAAIVSVAASMLLIRSYGAVGAAVATSATLIVQNLLYQAGLARTAVGLPSATHVVTFVMIALAVTLLTALQLAFGMPLAVGLALTAIVSIGLLLASRDSLQIGRYFPELLRVPLLRDLIGGSGGEVGRRVA